MNSSIQWILTGPGGKSAATNATAAPSHNSRCSYTFLYFFLGRYEESPEALKKARAYHYKKENELARLIADGSAGRAYRIVGRLDSASTWMNDVYDRAMKRYDQESSPESAEWVGFSNRESGEIALAQGNPKTPVDHFKKAKKYLMEARMPEWDAKGFEELNKKIEKKK